MPEQPITSISRNPCSAYLPKFSHFFTDKRKKFSVVFETLSVGDT